MGLRCLHGTTSPLTLPGAMGCSWEEMEQNGVCWRWAEPAWGHTHRHVAVQGAQQMLGGTDEGPPESIHGLHGPGQPAGGEEDQAFCCIPGHGWDLLHAGDARGTGGLQVLSHAAHEPGVLSRLPRETSSASAPGRGLCPTGPSRQDRAGPGFPIPFAALSLRDFSWLLCKSHHSSEQQGLCRPRGMLCSGLCFLCRQRQRALTPTCCFPSPGPSGAHAGDCSQPHQLTPPLTAGTTAWDFSGVFRGSEGSSVLTSHSSKGVLNIQARVTLPGTEAAPLPTPSCILTAEQGWRPGAQRCGGTASMLAWAMGRRMLWSIPSSLLCFSPYLAVVGVFLPCLLLLLLRCLALALAQPARAALPFTAGLGGHGGTGLGQATLEGEQKTTTQRELAGPILFSLRISQRCTGSRELICASGEKF